MRKKVDMELPSVELLEAELKRDNYHRRYGRALRSTIYALIIVAAIVVLVAMLWMPVLQITGLSMSPTLSDGEVVVAWKGSSFETGDIVAFYYGNQILVKRVIAGPGDWVDIDGEGRVYVNGEELNEHYLEERALGECDIELPYQVPESKYFVMGDQRGISIDSRSTAIGCISKDQFVGKLLFCVWPLESFGLF